MSEDKKIEGITMEAEFDEVEPYCVKTDSHMIAVKSAIMNGACDSITISLKDIKSLDRFKWVIIKNDRWEEVHYSISMMKVM